MRTSLKFFSLSIPAAIYANHNHADLTNPTNKFPTNRQFSFDQALDGQKKLLNFYKEKLSNVELPDTVTKNTEFFNQFTPDPPSRNFADPTFLSKLGIKFPGMPASFSLHTGMSRADDNTTINYDIHLLTQQYYVEHPKARLGEHILAPFFDYKNVCPNSPLLQQPKCKPADDPLYRYPTTDGTCNNRVDPRRGKAKFPLKRLLPAAYHSDGISDRLASDGKELPLPRKISVTLQETVPKKSNLTHMFTQWGQFITHDLVHTPEMMKPNGGKIKDCTCDSVDPACLKITIPYNDVQHRTESKTCMHIVKSTPVPDALCNFKVRNQINRISSYIDATTVYGNSDDIMNMVRDKRPLTYNGDNLGMLLFDSSSGEDLLPNQEQDANKKATSAFGCPHAQNIEKKPCTLAGDVRVAENVGLASTHLLFMREHNRIAKFLRAMNPNWSGDKIFHETRLIIIAMHQQITYQEYLPALLGPKFMKRYGLWPTSYGYYFGYDGHADASISNEFTTAALRFGHAMVADEFSRRPAEPEKEPAKEPLRMKETLWHPFHLYKYGMASDLMRGLVHDPSLEADTVFGQDMHQFLFAKHNSGKFGKDLFAINIARGREHGLRSYNDYRAYCGLHRAVDFMDFNKEMSQDKVYKLKILYDHVDDVDLYVGGLSETPTDGAAVGPTFACIMGEQFADLKRGDRYWYENGGCETVFTPAQLNAIKKGASLSRLICNCAYGTKRIRRQAFLMSSPEVDCEEITDLDLSPWKEPFVYSVKMDEKTGEQVNVDPKDTGEYTAWFPESASGRLDLKTISEERPDETCRNALGTEYRKVNEKWQIRFICPAGTIHATDVPRVPSTDPINFKSGQAPRWTMWFDHNKPTQSNSFDDVESLKNLLHEQPNNICKNPLAIQAKTLDDSMFARETKDVFEALSAKDGLICRGQHQPSGQCFDYKVRYLCLESELNDTPMIVDGYRSSIPSKLTSSKDKNKDTSILKKGVAKWSSWISSSNNIYKDGDIENISHIFANFPDADFCLEPLSIQARVVATRLTPGQTGDVIRMLNYKKGLHCYNEDQGSRDRNCSNYEIRVLCKVMDPIPARTVAGGAANNFSPRIPNPLETLANGRLEALRMARKLCDSHGMCCP